MFDVCSIRLCTKILYYIYLWLFPTEMNKIHIWISSKIVPKMFLIGCVGIYILVLCTRANISISYPESILRSGVDVMITIFCDFWQFSAKKLAFFSKINVMIKILHNLALFYVKTPIFFWIFRWKYLKNHNIGPGSYNARIVKIYNATM
jgi:hypothetical protein